jgi:hypothetical protein
MLENPFDVSGASDERAVVGMEVLTKGLRTVAPFMLE